MRSLIIAVAAAALAAPLNAQSAKPSIEQMRTAVSAGELRQARRAAEEIARDDSDQVAAAEANWLLATLDNADGRTLRAAVALDRVAAQAAAYGDPVLRARALLESSTLYLAERRYAVAAARIDELRPLLRSPFLPAELRQEAAARLHL